MVARVLVISVLDEIIFSTACSFPLIILFLNLSTFFA
jgi:hypothetical protein